MTVTENHMAGRAGLTICAACSHIHTRRETVGERTQEWCAGCFCGCVASGSDYYGCNVPLDTYEPKKEPLPATVRPVEPARSGWAEVFMGMFR